MGTGWVARHPLGPFSAMGRRGLRFELRYNCAHALHRVSVRLVFHASIARDSKSGLVDGGWVPRTVTSDMSSASVDPTLRQHLLRPKLIGGGYHPRRFGRTRIHHNLAERVNILLTENEASLIETEIGRQRRPMEAIESLRTIQPGPRRRAAARRRGDLRGPRRGRYNWASAARVMASQPLGRTPRMTTPADASTSPNVSWTEPVAVGVGPGSGTSRM